jgi:hypothetical protein
MKRLHLFQLIVFISAGFSISCSAQTVVPYTDPNIHYMGRIGIKDDAAELTWTASSAIINTG